ncbi:MAG TPA: YHS domain-containing protein [Planctomycetaceae bacterium]|nr:YHS domain-containing protein [Planctomycetaceae bacterium]
MNIVRFTSVGLMFGVGLCLCGFLIADETAAPSHDKEACQEALSQFNGLIGKWRGAAQPTRGSTKGAWTEKAEWIWDVKKDAVSLRYDIEDGQQLKSARLSYRPDNKQYRLHATFADDTERDYTGTLTGNKLVLESAEDQGKVYRIGITLLNEKRTLVLLEQRPANSDRFARIVEVGYTRDGTSLAVEGQDGPECIVTGGKGTMSTVYKGKTYWFCCTGCRDAFNDDPDGIIAEAAARAEKKKAAKKP